MNPVLLASASALAEATPEKMAISAPTTPAGGRDVYKRQGEGPATD